ncbi:MAG: hypothetical protein MR298_00840 [Odoribacter sp.]|nr:hypothetical protein [Odoribacter sp.]MDY3033050.1 hypothetical protein [Odoribacter sp.]
MKRKQFLTAALQAGIALLMFCACSSEEFAEQSLSESTENSRLYISVNVPATGGIVVDRFTRAGVAGEVHENELKSLNVYLFKKGAGTGETDYTFAKEASITQFGDGSDGKKTCSVDIDAELIGETVKVVLIANDKPTNVVLTKDVTTLEAFRAAVATASVTDKAAADVLVGNKTTGFPMAVVSEDVKLTAAGATATVSLVRSVARIDIKHNAPGLTIKAVKLTNVNNKSCLLSKAAAGVNIPLSVNKVELAPIEAYTTVLGSSGLGHSEPVAAQCAFYLYEQEVTAEGSSPVVTIYYEIDSKTGSLGEGIISVKFQKKPENSWVSVVRNTIYTIELGDGKPFDKSQVIATFKVVDWISGEEITDVINPDTEGQN